MWLTKTRFNDLRQLICIGFLICISLKPTRAENGKDYGDYPKEVRRYLQCLFTKGQHKYAFRADYPGGFDTWQKQTRPVLHKLVGLDKIAEQVGRHTPTVRLQQIDDVGQYTRQKGWIETEPHVRNPFLDTQAEKNAALSHWRSSPTDTIHAVTTPRPEYITIRPIATGFSARIAMWRFKP